MTLQQFTYRLRELLQASALSDDRIRELLPILTSIDSDYRLFEAQSARMRHELHDASAQMANAQSELRTLFENLSAVIFSVEMPSERVLQISPACEQIYGFGPEAFYDTPRLWFEVIVEEDRPIIHSNWTVMEAGLSFTQEYRIRHMDGHLRWLSTRITPTLGPDGNLSRLDGVTTDITYRKTMEEKLRSSQRNLEASQRISNTGSWEIPFRSDAAISTDQRWSAQLYTMLGYRPSSVLPTTALFLKHVHPEDRPRISNVFDRLPEGEPMNEAFRVITKKGLTRHMQARSEMLKTKIQGKPVKIVGTLQDISDRVSASEKLQGAEANLNSILENTDTAYVLVDTDTTILAFNNVAAETLKAFYGLDLKHGLNLLSAFPDHDRREAFHAYQQVLRNKAAFSYEVQRTLNDGHDGWFFVRMHPVLKNDELAGITLAITDVTERRKHENLLHESNERYELVTQATRDVIWDWQPESAFIYRSHNYNQHFGYTLPDQMEHIQEWRDRIAPSDRGMVWNSLIEHMQSGSEMPWQCDYGFTRFDGTTAFVRDRAVVLRDERAKPIRLVGAMRDITETKLLELDRMSVTEDLINQNRQLEQFAYMVSHNLRLPVANIVGLSALIHDVPTEGDDLSNILAEISKAGSSLNDITEDLNTILDIQSGKQAYEPVDLHQLCLEIVQTLRLGDEQAFQITTDMEVNQMVTSRAYMHSIFLNLISNAYKYRQPDRKGELHIRSLRDGNTTRISFQDNGIGIDLKRNRDALFGLYKRFNSNLEGKGIGLFMVKTQVEQLNGTITVDSEPMKGTTFTLHINAEE